MNSARRQETLLAIERFVIQREKLMKERAQLTKQLFGGDYTLTQLHIVSLINKYSAEANNALLARKLGLSRPAVTKAVNHLLDSGLITAGKKDCDQKSVYYSLSPDGERMADVQDKIHKGTIERYERLLDSFAEQELGTVTKFLNTWTAHMENSKWKSDIMIHEGGSHDNQEEV